MRRYGGNSVHGLAGAQGIPSTSRKLMEEMERLLDPSKNMMRYRDAVLKAKPPMIPFFREHWAAAATRFGDAPR